MLFPSLMGFNQWFPFLHQYLFKNVQRRCDSAVSVLPSQSWYLSFWLIVMPLWPRQASRWMLLPLYNRPADTLGAALQCAFASGSVNTPQCFSFGGCGSWGRRYWLLSTHKAQRGPGVDVTETGVQINWREWDCARRRLQRLGFHFGPSAAVHLWLAQLCLLVLHQCRKEMISLLVWRGS